MEGPLYTDVVMGIVMSHLKVRDLLNCRKVSKFWNKIASSAVRKRSTMIKIRSQAELTELVECMRESSDFPFAGLKFLEPWRLSSSEAIEFSRNHGPRFTRLHLGTSKWSKIQDLAPFLNNLPRLFILEVSKSWEPTPDAGLLMHAAGQEDGSVLNLPSLRTLIIYSEINEDFLHQVCAAASPSLQIECLDATSTYRILQALERVGKLQAVSAMKIDDGLEDYVMDNVRLLSIESLKLTKLDFSICCSLSLYGLKKILISSQHTLKDLRLDEISPSQFSSECPVLTKLTTLSLCIIANGSYEYVFQGNQGHKFPALKELKLCTPDDEEDAVIANFSDGLFSAPSLATIALDGRVDINVIKDLARCFPNVVEIRLKHRYFGDDPSVIWSVGAFKFLEKLKIWDYPLRWPNNNHMNMDRFLTGMCSAICKNLLEHTQQDLTDSPFNEILRKSPSILQLKNLKQLTIKLEEKLEELLEEPPFISKVSVWYALQMMPNLKARFLYEPSSLSKDFGNDERDTAVGALEAAFKHLQPYVELEPFFD